MPRGVSNKTKEFPQWFILKLIKEEDRDKAERGVLRSKDEITLYCSVHGEYIRPAGQFINMTTMEPKLKECPLCSRVNSGVKIANTKPSFSFPAWFIEELANKEDKDKALRKELKTSDKVDFVCSLHGVYNQLVGSHIKVSTGERQSGCPKCAREKITDLSKQTKCVGRDFPSWFIEELANEDDRQEALEGTLSSVKYVDFVCPSHGIYQQMVYNHIEISTGERRAGCPKCVHGKHASKLEDELVLYLEELGVKRIERNIRGIIRNEDTSRWYELDIFLPDYNVAIEINGYYYHATLGGPREHQKDKYYHQNKFLLCEEQGIRLISIFDFEWYSNNKRIKNLISDVVTQKERLYARSLKVKETTLSEAKEFCNEYHLQGWSRLSQICYGLFKEEECISLMTFGRKRYSCESNSYELHRYCVKSGYTVIGGAERLLSQFKRDNPSIKELVTYSDNNFFTGFIYTKMGFTFDGITAPGYVWVSKKNGNVIPREQTQVKNLIKEFPEIYQRVQGSQGSIEDKIMLELDCCKVYKAGNKRWIIRR